MTDPNVPPRAGERAHADSHRSQQLIESCSKEGRAASATSFIADDRGDERDAAVAVAEGTRVSTKERRRAAERRADAAVDDRPTRRLRRRIHVRHIESVTLPSCTSGNWRRRNVFTPSSVPANLSVM